jgi:triacylglycerol esterase/lipase EstA (alpha/beta hydrolase family)
MSIKRLVNHFLVSILLLASAQISTSTAHASSRYLRQTTEADQVIIFVHGVLGEGGSTWQTGAQSWPDLMISDTTFNTADVFVYSYPTALWATMSIDELAENMRLQFEANGVSRYKRVIFLTHSMGGLVTRAYLLKNRDIATRTAFAYFFSTPTKAVK